MPRQFVNLHGHTTFSPGDGYAMPAAHVARVAELGQPGMAVTEHGNVSSHAKLEQAAKAAGIKPVFGCELYCDVGNPLLGGQLKHHLTALAMDAVGLRNLYTVVSKSWENFHYKPTTTGEMLADHSEGLIVLSGCLGGRLSTALLGGKGEAEKTRADLGAAERVAAQFRELFGDRYYLEVMPHPTLAKQKAANQAYARLSRRMGIPLVATGDVHYPQPQDQDLYPLLHAIDRGGKSNTVEAQAQSWEYGIVLAHRSAGEVYRNLLDTGLTAKEAAGAIQTTLDITDRVNVTLPKLKDLEFPAGEPIDRYMWRRLQEGWRYRRMDRLHGRERERALAQVRYEFGLMKDKGFLDYFAVISDMVCWAKDSFIPVGPARGSAAASLCCYLWRITEVNPLLYPNLIFERFIDINRHDLPDVDLDFDDEQRWKVRDYLVRKYGEDRVGNIGTFVMYKGKNSLDDVARVRRIPIAAVNQVKDGLLERSSGDLRAANTIEDSITLFPKVAKVFKQWPGLNDALRLEGNLKGFSVHAAGLVVANEPLTNSLAVYTREVKDPETGRKTRGAALSIDKYDAEYIGALKIDALGLTTMGVIRHAISMIGMTLEELYAVPLDDEKVYEGFRANRVIGVFQFDGRAMRSVNREVKPDTFAEVCDINALARPGPLHSGAAAEYIMAKHGKKRVEKLHPVVSEITAHTQGQIVYQEQILRVVRELGGFTWEEAAHVRKLISKKQGEQAFNRLQSKFLAGCAERGVREIVAIRVWKQLVTAGAYAFNAAHCVSYGLLAYWTMWLKVNHPLAFYCASLRKFGTGKHKEKALDILREASSVGIKIFPPDPEMSELSWAVEDDALRAGLWQIPGVGETTAKAMLEWRSGVRLTALDTRVEWRDYLAVGGVGPVTVSNIEKFCGQDDPFGIHALARMLAGVRGYLRAKGEGRGLPIPMHKSEDVPYEPVRGEYTWVGKVRLRNLKDIYELHRSRTGEELDPKKVKQPQYVNYVVITGEDETGPLVITVHRWDGFYEKHKDDIWDMDPDKDVLLVRGYKRDEYRRAIYATELYVLSPREK